MGFVVVAVTVGAVVLLVLLARLLDRVRGVDPEEKWSGWYRSKTHDITQTGGLKGGEYDSLNDRGNRDRDGGLQ